MNVKICFFNLKNKNGKETHEYKIFSLSLKNLLSCNGESLDAQTSQNSSLVRNNECASQSGRNNQRIKGERQKVSMKR